jgi:hypothetical protein
MESFFKSSKFLKGHERPSLGETLNIRVAKKNTDITKFLLEFSMFWALLRKQNTVQYRIRKILPVQYKRTHNLHITVLNKSPPRGGGGGP